MIETIVMWILKALFSWITERNETKIRKEKIEAGHVVHDADVKKAALEKLKQDLTQKPLPAGVAKPSASDIDQGAENAFDDFLNSVSRKP